MGRICCFQPNQIKSANPITYDAKGEIPPSKRFTDSKDIRYSTTDPLPLDQIPSAYEVMEHLPTEPTVKDLIKGKASSEQVKQQREKNADKRKMSFQIEMVNAQAGVEKYLQQEGGYTSEKNSMQIAHSGVELEICSLRICQAITKFG